jgi:multidrug efflux system membrane fusion protein
MNKSMIIAGLIAVGSVAWVASGQLAKAPPAPAPGEAVAAPPEEALPRVRVMPVSARPMTSILTLQGRTMAERKVELKAETGGAVTLVAADRGAWVGAGDVIVRLATEDRQARLDEARALLAQREIEFRAASRLNEQGYRADTQLAEAKAGLDAAAALVRLAEIEMERLAVHAPFAGNVAERHAELGDFIDRGDPVATIVDLDPIRVRAEVSERHLGAIAPGRPATVRLLDGTTLEGRVTYLGTVATGATRTFPIEVEVANPEGLVIEGVTAEVRLALDEVVAHLLPPSALSLDEAGTLGIKAVDGDGRVVFHEVRVIDSSSEGVWLAGLPADVTLITVGQEFVLPGQRVEPVPAGAQPGDAS